MPRPPAADAHAPTAAGPDRVARARAEVTIREMRPHEAPEVGAITLAGYDAYGSITGEYRSFLGDPLARIDGCTALLVAEVEGRIVGTVTYVLPGDEQWEGRPVADGDGGFRVLAVAPGNEGRGIGRALVERCLELSREHGCRRMIITSMTWMPRAHRLYEAMGFVRRPDLAIRFPGGEGVVFTADLVADAAAHFPAPGPVPEVPPWYADVWTH